jgi:ferredoxin
MMKDAFANDDSLGKRENAGLKKGPNYNSEVTINGKPVKNAVAGQKVSQVAAAAGQKISYSCNKGDCATWYVDYTVLQLPYNDYILVLVIVAPESNTALLASQ